ncbi:MAG: replication factor C large subunit [Methanosarcinaceae archaeon]|nr:replication factor C large subunit [Methanosarcinaceae archaeon]
MDLNWVEKYRPVTLKQVVGNKRAIHDLRLWAESWSFGVPDKRAALVHGAPGIGKTSAVNALANDLGWEVIELNASDQRTAAVIDRVVGEASKSSSFFSSNARRLIILDEADNLHGNYDRGGSRAIADIIRNTVHPIVLIANDAYGLTPTIRSLCLEIKFSSIQARSIVPILTRICESESIDCSRAALEKIAAGAGGDVRCAVNDLQAAANGKSSISESDVVTSFRDSKETIFQALGKILRGSNRKEAIDASFNVEESPEDLFLWIDENLPYQFGIDEVNPEFRKDVSDAFSILVRSDSYLGRVRKRQVYRLWRYASFLMTVGPMSVRVDDRRLGFVKMRSPGLLKRFGENRASRNMRDGIAIKLSSRHFDSMRSCRYDLIPVYMRLMEDDDVAVSLATLDNFDLDELVYLSGSRSATKKIKSIYEKVQQNRKHLETTVEKSKATDAKTSTQNSSTSFANFDKSQKTLAESFEDATKETDKENKKDESHLQKSLFDF